MPLQSIPSNDIFYDSLDDHIDTFTEALMGKYGRPEFQPEFAIMFQNIETINMQEFLDGITEFLVSMTEVLDSKYDSDLLNIRDEILGETNIDNQTKIVRVSRNRYRKNINRFNVLD